MSYVGRIISTTGLKLRELYSNLVKIEGVELKLSNHSYNFSHLIFYIYPSIQSYLHDKLLILIEVLTELTKNIITERFKLKNLC